MTNDRPVYMTFTIKDEPAPGIRYARYIAGVFAVSKDNQEWRTATIDHSWWQEALIQAATETAPGGLPQGRDVT